MIELYSYMPNERYDTFAFLKLNGKPVPLSAWCLRLMMQCSGKVYIMAHIRIVPNQNAMRITLATDDFREMMFSQIVPSLFPNGWYDTFHGYIHTITYNCLDLWILIFFQKCVHDTICEFLYWIFQIFRSCNIYKFQSFSSFSS